VPLCVTKGSVKSAFRIAKIRSSDKKFSKNLQFPDVEYVGSSYFANFQDNRNPQKIKNKKTLKVVQSQTYHVANSRAIRTFLIKKFQNSFFNLFVITSHGISIKCLRVHLVYVWLLSANNLFVIVMELF